MASCTEELIPIKDPHGLLQYVASQEISCLITGCRRRVLQWYRYEHEQARNAVLHQNPCHPQYDSIFRRWIMSSLCSVHQKSFFENVKADRLHYNVAELLKALRIAFMVSHLSGSTDHMMRDPSLQLLMDREMDIIPRRYCEGFGPSQTSTLGVQYSANTPKASCSMYLPIMKTLSPQEIDGGWIYILCGALLTNDKEEIMKIGYSKERPAKRLQEINSNCGLDILENKKWIYRSFYTPHGRRVEKLVQKELSDYGHMIDFRCFRHKQGKVTRHQEFFEVSMKIAIRTVEYWIKWIQPETDGGFNPYTQEGHFQAWSRLFSPEISADGLGINSFLRDSRGASWHQHDFISKASIKTCRCEPWQTCTRPVPHFRKFRKVQYLTDPLSESQISDVSPGPSTSATGFHDITYSPAHSDRLPRAGNFQHAPALRRQSTFKHESDENSSIHRHVSDGLGKPPPISFHTPATGTGFDSRPITPEYCFGDGSSQNDSQQSFKSALDDVSAMKPDWDMDRSMQSGYLLWTTASNDGIVSKMKVEPDRLKPDPDVLDGTLLFTNTSPKIEECDPRQTTLDKYLIIPHDPPSRRRSAPDIDIRLQSSKRLNMNNQIRRSMGA